MIKNTICLVFRLENENFDKWCFWSFGHVQVYSSKYQMNKVKNTTKSNSVQKDASNDASKRRRINTSYKLKEYWEREEENNGKDNEDILLVGYNDEERRNEEEGEIVVYDEYEIIDNAEEEKSYFKLLVEEQNNEEPGDNDLRSLLQSFQSSSAAVAVGSNNDYCIDDNSYYDEEEDDDFNARPTSTFLNSFELQLMLTRASVMQQENYGGDDRIWRIFINKHHPAA